EEGQKWWQDGESGPIFGGGHIECDFFMEHLALTAAHKVLSLALSALAMPMAPWVIHNYLMHFPSLERFTMVYSNADPYAMRNGILWYRINLCMCVKHAFKEKDIGEDVWQQVL